MVVVGTMANQISRKKIFIFFSFLNLAFTRPRVPNSTLHCVKYPKNDSETYFWQNEGLFFEITHLEGILQQNFERVFSVNFKKNLK